MNRFKFLLTLGIVGSLLCACKKDTIVEKPKQEPLPVDTITGGGDTTSLVISFTAMANNKVLVPTTGTYTNTSTDNFTVTKFNYYISNVKLRRDNGTVFYEPESYHIIKHVEGMTSFTIHGLPKGNYNHIEFLIGVDSLRNVSGAQKGALDVSHGMFWEWSSGYIFFKMEGTYVSAQVPTDGEYAIHIGGFEAAKGFLQTAAFDLAQAIVAKPGVTSKLYYNTVIDEIFKNPKKIGFDTYYASINDAMFRSMAENYRDMFVVAKIEN